VSGLPIRVLAASGTPAEMGALHGAGYAAEIVEYTGDRVERSADGTTMSRGRILALAERLLPAHRDYDQALFEEMEALAEAAGITPAEALIVGGYTDFIDTVRAHAGGAPVEDACTAAIVPDHLADGAGFLAQTWDMHASATPHVLLLRLRPESGPAALVYSTVGCLGQIGMNEAGVAIGINNLTAADGRVGVTWPFVVRKALTQTSVEAALRCVLDARLAGGHNFLLLGADGLGYSVEAMPTVTHITELGAAALVHTNHCVVAATQSVEGPRPAALQASSIDRLKHAAELLDVDRVNVGDLMALTRDERSICRHPEPPFDYESCGAAIMRPRTGDLWACWGVPSENEFEHHRV
jgi:isopenicillin-N N-acyltransferase-like protein